MSYIIQFINLHFFKMILSGNNLRGIQCRTILAIILTLTVLLIEIAVFSLYWDSIPDMIKFDYDFNGVANDVCEKKWLWYNLGLQIIICLLVFFAKRLAYRFKRILRLVYDQNNKLISIIDKRFSMFAWEIAMLVVTTEQGYLFDLLDVVESPLCDDVVTVIFLFFQITLIIELIYDYRKLKNEIKKSHGM